MAWRSIKHKDNFILVKFGCMGPAGERGCFLCKSPANVTGGNAIAAAICIVSLDFRDHVEGKILLGQRSVFG
jgi:hypothetical protein